VPGCYFARRYTQFIGQRLNAGRLSKVQRGEYVQRLPTGLMRLSDQTVIKDPDQQIQHVIVLIVE
jgi:DNA invertase Pin-like site-specific DNA recombinase